MATDVPSSFVSHPPRRVQGRTLDFAATSAAQVLDWYLALAALIPQSTEPLIDEPTLRQKMETMGLGSNAQLAMVATPRATRKGRASVG